MEHAIKYKKSKEQNSYDLDVFENEGGQTAKVNRDFPMWVDKDRLKIIFDRLVFESKNIFK